MALNGLFSNFKAILTVLASLQRKINVPDLVPKNLKNCKKLTFVLLCCDIYIYRKYSTIATAAFPIYGEILLSMFSTLWLPTSA